MLGEWLENRSTCLFKKVGKSQKVFLFELDLQKMHAITVHHLFKPMETNIFGLKMIVKSGLEFFILKSY